LDHPLLEVPMSQESLVLVQVL
jgi:hypothetical protein